MFLAAVCFSSPVAAQSVQLMWSGAATHESIQVKARIDGPRFVRLAVSDSPNLSNPILSDPVEASESDDFVVTLSVAGLTPDSKYYYAIGETDGTLHEPFGSFQTFPAPGCSAPYDFSIAVSSDASVGSNALVFEAVEARDPDLLFHLGGLHYADIVSNEVSEYRAAYRTALTRPRQASLYRNVSSVYIWDDHDFGGNDSDSTYIGRASAKEAYLEYVPHHPLESDSPETGLYRAFTLGRVRIIVTDARFHRSPKTDADGPAKTMLGPTQKEWLKAELLAAGDRYPLTVWINPVPWIEAETAGSDRWGGFAVERAEIAQFIADHNLHEKLIMLSSDAHMMAADDGSYSGYASAEIRAGFPVIHAAALDRAGDYKGGPYRLGARPGTMQYGLLTLTDECADRIDVEFEALGSLDQAVVSDTDYNIDDPITFRHSFFAGGEYLIRKGASWRYVDDGTLPGADWASPNYIDSGWKSGHGQFGYGDVPDGKAQIDVVTEIEFGFSPQFKHITYYFRTFFEVSDKEDIKSLISNIKVDDGIVVYLNGFEVLRRNLPGGIIGPETLAESAIEGADEATFFPADLSVSVANLFNGTNVLAVEVHQVSAASPDVTFDLELFAVTSEIAANIKPVADVSASPRSGDAPLEVTFDGSGSFDPDGSIVSYSWNFGDGVTSGQPTVAHTFAIVGTYDATLTVTDNLGRTDLALVEIVVTNAPPEAVIIADPMTGETPLTISFDGSSSVDPNGSIISHDWSFGTGDSASGEFVEYVYEDPGTFWTTLSVIDNLGEIGQDSVQIVVAQGNLPPLSLGLPDTNVPEDTGRVDVPLRDYFDDDRDTDEMLTFSVDQGSNESLFSLIAFDDATDVLTFVPEADSNGSAHFVIEVTDSEGLVTVDTLHVSVEPVNDAPDFVAGGDTVVTTDAGRVTVEGWALNINPGPSNEAAQTVKFRLTTERAGLFASDPVISADGTLFFEPVADSSGLASVMVILQDNGGTARGGVDTSSTIVFFIRTNHRPIASFEFVRSEFGSLTVRFDASASTDLDGTIVEYSWDFGDGSVGDGIQISHTFTDTAMTDVTLTVTDNFGSTAKAESSVAVSSEAESMPETFMVGAFFPNPANTGASLIIALPEPRPTEVTFVDVTGRVVSRQRFDARAGYQRKLFDTSQLPAGIYFVLIEAGAETALRRITVIR